MLLFIFCIAVAIWDFCSGSGSGAGCALLTRMYFCTSAFLRGGFCWYRGAGKLFCSEKSTCMVRAGFYFWQILGCQCELTFKSVPFVTFYSWCINSESFVGLFAATSSTVACCWELLCNLLAVANRLFHNCAQKFCKKFATVTDRTKFG